MDGYDRRYCRNCAWVTMHFEGACAICDEENAMHEIERRLELVRESHVDIVVEPEDEEC